VQGLVAWSLILMIRAHSSKLGCELPMEDASQRISGVVLQRQVANRGSMPNLTPMHSLFAVRAGQRGKKTGQDERTRAPSIMPVLLKMFATIQSARIQTNRTHSCKKRPPTLVHMVPLCIESDSVCEDIP